ncbi:hypothetical protein RJ640_000986 [Escallonia rubra]|uniref:Uncharacterized protein n=1 Tax=Escallonia rubra TaxID=112253 RepID=A0AA88RG79_9ASTE|nr:hypothetical protein RJ640_000986 [Escallonia rubra]
MRQNLPDVVGPYPETLMVVILRLGTHPNHKSSTTTGFKIYPLLRTLPEFLLNSHRVLEWTTGILSTCPTNTAVFCRPGKVQVVFTTNPSNVKHMLKTNFKNYLKGTRFTSLLEDFLSRGIFNSDGHVGKPNVHKFIVL